VYVARSLGAEMFGVMMFGQAVVLYFTHLAACGVDLTGMRDIAQDETRAATLAPSILTVRLLVSLGLMVVLAIGALLVLPRLEAVVVAIYALTLFGHGPNPKFVLLGLSRPIPVAVSRTLGELAYLALVLLCVRLPGDVVSVPWAQFVGDALAVAVMLCWLKRRGVSLPLALDWRAVAPLFRRSFPLVINILLGLMIYNADLLVLRYFKDSTTVGWYSASYQLISFLINMSWAYSYSLLPSLTQAAAHTGERRALYLTSLAQTFAVALPVAVGGALVARPIIALVFGAQYAPSAAPLAILIASIPFMLYKDVAMVAMVVAGHEKAVMRMTAIAVVFNLVGNLIVTRPFGMIGAAGTTLATEILRFVLAAAFVRRDGLPLIPWRRVVKSVTAVSVMAAVVVGLGPRSLFVLLVAGAASYTGVLAMTGAIELRRGALPALRV
jgi:O-antigen/teichoic acid export membrane protein